RFQTLRDLVSDSMAIDMGSANTVVAVHKLTGEVVAIGREAREMQGREARDVSLVAPMIDGVVADFERSQEMLAYFVRKARSGVSHFSRRAVMSVLSGITQVEQRALMSAAEHAKIGRVYMVEEGLAAAVGAGVSVEQREASAVVDIGGDSINIAVVARGQIVFSQSERIGSIDIDNAVIDRLRRHHGLIIGAPTAERLKIELGSAIEPENPARSMTVKGRDVQEGSARAVEVTSEEITGAAMPVVGRMARVVQRALGDLQPEVLSDIYDRGVILTGGGALFDGMSELLTRETKLTARIADDPRHACVRGLQQLFDEPLLLRRVARNEHSTLLEADKYGDE
ncbi:MAG TPA: rod shape-determining protein, partial [Pyrinomonadaceae bacterium]|nr:rod shape-determining protein [Pyrinomonadaceae bacterium]